MNRVSHPRRRAVVPALLAAALISLAGAGGAAATVSGQSESQNWAGYVAQSKSGQSFSHLSGSWTVPTVSSDAGDGSAAFWVGLGGAGQNSQALEQIGTGADVSNGQASYYAWYELVPQPMHKLTLTVKPGDKVTGSVSVSGQTVTLTLTDRTSGRSQTRTSTVSDPDTSSAEWIAEAPSAEYSDGSTQVVPLADFGTVTFTGTSATAGGQTGSLNDPAWSLDQVSLSGQGGGTMFHGGRFGGGGVAVADDGAASSAVPGSVSSDGSSFAVQDGASGYTPAASTGTPASAYDSPGSGYPDGYGYGGGYGGYGYGYGGGGGGGGGGDGYGGYGGGWIG